jgi:hypothetical protein
MTGVRDIVLCMTEFCAGNNATAGTLRY